MTKLTYRRRRDLGQSDKSKQALASFVAVCAVFLILSAAGLAQELAATLTGTVTDPSGALVAGATVVVHSNETGVDVRSVTTTNTGSFNITNLPAGRYTVTVKDAGFQTFVANEVVLNVAEKHTLDVQLKTGKTTETVEVHRGEHAHSNHHGGRVRNRHRRPGSRAGAKQPQLRAARITCNPASRTSWAMKPGFGLSKQHQ